LTVGGGGLSSEVLVAIIELKGRQGKEARQGNTKKKGDGSAAMMCGGVAFAFALLVEVRRSIEGTRAKKKGNRGLPGAGCQLERKRVVALLLLFRFVCG